MRGVENATTYDHSLTVAAQIFTASGAFESRRRFNCIQCPQSACLDARPEASADGYFTETDHNVPPAVM